MKEVAERQVSTGRYRPDLAYFTDVRWQREKRSAWMAAGLMLVVTAMLLIMPSKTGYLAAPCLLFAILVGPGVRQLCRYYVRKEYENTAEAGKTTSILHFSGEGVRFEHSTLAETVKNESSGAVPWEHFQRAEVSGDQMILVPKRGIKWGWVIRREWFASNQDWDEALRIVNRHLSTRG